MYKPALGKWPSIAGEQLVRKGAGAAGGPQREHELETCLGAKAASTVRGCVWRSVAGRWREGDPCPPLSTSEATPAVLCPAQERCGATGESPAKGHADDCAGFA